MAKKITNTTVKLGANTILQEALDGLVADIGKTKSISANSDDRSAHLALSNGIYYCGFDAASRGYPSDYFFMIHLKWDNNLCYQIGFHNHPSNGNYLRVRLINPQTGLDWKSN